MALATIVVHLDSSPRTAVRLALAVRLATRFGARLTGLFAEMSEAYRVGLVATWPSAEHVAATAAARTVFEAATAELGDRATFLEINRGGEQEILARITDIARTFDLVVLGQSEHGVRVPIDLPEQVILESGRPVLMVPFAGVYDDVGQRPLFAWHHSRGATRALHDALPLIAHGAVALVVGARRPNEPVDEFADMVLAQLSARGVAARFQSVVVDEIRLMDTLLNQAADHAADLLVIGAFDNTGFSFTGRGSGTRYVLRHMTLPVLFSH
ncbi:universal stress protein [Blastochloris viridis]|uniref:Universal stress protein family n=1 Tax=Blastochloris viridis TaxID=1079 RepID=A0A0H5BGA8_BLAVI|nr:universal stress protein [Blastochloris viridis]ALK09921.1 Universal stress protein family protein [Blastochloris viridis]BAS00170.1 universal stress protein family [Blastochloris viridis]CUU42584.1 Universal stress protein family protein [Blastochloris viridis]